MTLEPQAQSALMKDLRSDLGEASPLQDVTTGEEDEDEIYSQRSKLCAAHGMCKHM